MESSDDEPLLKLLKRPLKDATNTGPPKGKGAMSAKTRRGKTPTKTDKGPPGKATIAKKNKRSSDYGNGATQLGVNSCFTAVLMGNLADFQPALYHVIVGRMYN